MSSYWLISVPATPSANGVIQQTKNVTQGFGSPCFKFDIPKLKVGTLDALMILSDEIAKYDQHADVALRRIVRAYSTDVCDEFTPADLSKLKVEVGMHGSDRSQVSPLHYLENFQWAEERFPAKGNLSELADTIHKNICESDEEVKLALANFSMVKNQLNTLKRKSGGNLLVRDLNGIVELRHYCLKPDGDPSQKIIPVFIVVSKQRWDEFKVNYESYTREVVPASMRIIQDDDSYTLVRVFHLDCTSLQTFKDKVVESKHAVREFQYNAEAIQESEEEKQRLTAEEKKKKQEAIEALEVNFGEVFIMHLHLKAVRVFVESALWYSLPLNFQAMAIKVNPRKEAPLQRELDKTFATAKGNAPSGGETDPDDRQYVSFEYGLDFLSGE